MDSPQRDRIARWKQRVEQETSISSGAIPVVRSPPPILPIASSSSRAERNTIESRPRSRTILSRAEIEGRERPEPSKTRRQDENLEQEEQEREARLRERKMARRQLKAIRNPSPPPLVSPTPAVQPPRTARSIPEHYESLGRPSKKQKRGRKAMLVEPWEVFTAKNVNLGRNGRITLSPRYSTKGGIFGRGISSTTMKIGNTTDKTKRDDKDWREAWRRPDPSRPPGPTTPLQPYQPNIQRPRNPSPTGSERSSRPRMTKQRTRPSPVYDIKPASSRSSLMPPLPVPPAPVYPPSWPTWVTSPSSNSRHPPEPPEWPQTAPMARIVERTRSPFRVEGRYDRIKMNVPYQPSYSPRAEVREYGQPLTSAQRPHQYTVDTDDAYHAARYTPRRVSPLPPILPKPIPPSELNRQYLLANLPPSDPPYIDRPPLPPFSTSSQDTGTQFWLGGSRPQPPRLLTATRAESIILEADPELVYETARDFSFAPPPPPYPFRTIDELAERERSHERHQFGNRSSALPSERSHPIPRRNDDLDSLIQEVDQYLLPSLTRAPRLAAPRASLFPPMEVSATPRQGFHIQWTPRSMSINRQIMIPSSNRSHTIAFSPQKSNMFSPRRPIPPTYDTAAFPTVPPPSHSRSTRSVQMSIYSSNLLLSDEVEAKEVEQFGTTKRDWENLWKESSNAL